MTVHASVERMRDWIDALGEERYTLLATIERMRADLWNARRDLRRTRDGLREARASRDEWRRRARDAEAMLARTHEQRRLRRLGRAA